MGSSDTGLALSMTWQMFAVTLNGIDVNPQFIAPDTLRYNGIVDDTWLLTKGALFGPGNSSFAYSNGISVAASPESLCFRQIAGTISEEDVLCDRLAARYLDAGLPGTWFSALTEFGILVDVDSELALNQESELAGFVWDFLTFEGVGPDDMRTSLSYETGDRRLSVDLIMGIQNDGLLRCHGRVHRYLDSDSSESDWADEGEQLQALIGNWPADYRDVLSIAERFVTAAIFIGGA